MCFGGSPPDQSAEIARQKEVDRQARINEGTERINNTFSKFDDGYYSGLGKSYLDYYTPQLDTQYNDTKKQLAYKYGDQGALDSGAYNNDVARLTREYGVQRNQITDKSLEQQQGARSAVEQNRADLISQLEGGAGVESVASSALARAEAATRPPVYSPLADVFSSFTNALATSRGLQNQGYPGIPTGRSPALLGSGGNNSVKTVGP